MTVFIMMLFGCASTVDTQPSEQHHESPKIVELELPPVSRGFNTIIKGEKDYYPEVCRLLGISGSLRCTGTLIASNLVLTSGHCVEDAFDVVWVDFSGVWYLVEDVIRHPDYSIDCVSVENDAAILVLNRKVEGIPPARVNFDPLMPYKGSQVILVGHGSNIKKYSPLGTFWYYGTLESNPTNMKILTLRGTSVYFGDSGGPVYMLMKDGLKLVGIISYFSMDNGKIYENSACRTDRIHTWIEGVIKNEGMVTE